MKEDQESSIKKGKPAAANAPKIADLAPRKDAKGGGKTLGVTGSTAPNGGKTSSGFKVEIEGVTAGEGSPSI